MTVDSMPTSQLATLPPTAASSPFTTLMGTCPKSAMTCAARVGLTWQNLLALGAATGKPSA